MEPIHTCRRLPDTSRLPARGTMEQRTFGRNHPGPRKDHRGGREVFFCLGWWARAWPFVKACHYGVSAGAAARERGAEHRLPGSTRRSCGAGWQSLCI